MPEPNFVIAGAQRSGTTSLYHLLAQHPDVYLAGPLRPEPKFFIAEPSAERDRAWYLATYFSGVTHQRAIGEKSTSYMDSAEAPRRMKAMFPALRVLFVLRHPIERAISNYRFSLANKLETASFDEAVRDEAHRLTTASFAVSTHPWAYLARGRYAEHLARFLAYFRRDELGIILREDLRNDPIAVCRTVTRFLDVDSTFVPPETDVQHNASPAGPVRVSRATIDSLIEYYRELNSQLSEIIGRDLSHWNAITPELRAMTIET